VLSYDDAIRAILDAVVGPLPTEPAPLRSAVGRALAEDVVADRDLPPFDNSAMDGYAVHPDDLAAQLLLIGDPVHAGDDQPEPIRRGVAVPVFTGAPIPPGCGGIVMWEDTKRVGDREVLLGQPASPAFLRRAGSDLPRGARALSAGQTIDAGAIGLLAALDRDHILCPRQPRVAILSTGNELAPPEAGPLRSGQIRDSNGFALAAAVSESGGIVVAHRHVRDDPEATRDALREMAQICDVVISAGGVSLGSGAGFVGQTDHVTSALEAVGSLTFWKVAIKPGKPLAFGQIGDARFFGLPGNPVSALVTFELFVRPMLRKLAGHARRLRPVVTVVLAAPLPHTPGRREFARGRLETSGAEPDAPVFAVPFGAQESHRLASMAGADVLLVAHESRGDYAAGDVIPALLIA
jgi:molybdopterin molybdotransferase